MQRILHKSPPPFRRCITVFPQHYSHKAIIQRQCIMKWITYICMLLSVYLPACSLRIYNACNFPNKPQNMKTKQTKENSIYCIKEVVLANMHISAQVDWVETKEINTPQTSRSITDLAKVAKAHIDQTCDQFDYLCVPWLPCRRPNTNVLVCVPGLPC